MSRSSHVGLSCLVALCVGCSSGPHETALPLDHPANPDAPIPAFVPAASALDRTPDGGLPGGAGGGRAAEEKR